MTDELIVLAPMRGTSEVYHLAPTSTRATLCGRNGADWMDLQIYAEAALQSSYCCAVCAKKFGASR